MSRRDRNQRGASALEMAIVAPAFLLMIFAIIEVSLWMHARDVALSAAREGVASLRTASAEEQSKGVDAVETTAVDYARTLGDIVDPTAEATYDEGAGRVTVTVEGGVVDLIPGWDLSVSSTATGLIETFRPDLGAN
jgi:Flp pilus assembly protein TadG